MTGTAKKKNSLTREEAAALYEDLRKNFAAFAGNNPQQPKSKPAARPLSANGNGTYQRPAQPAQGYQSRTRPESAPGREEQILAMMLAKQANKKNEGFGKKLALYCVLIAAGLKFALGAVEVSGIMGVENAQATLQQKSAAANAGNFSEEQVALLKSLDSRRAELEEKRKLIDLREEELNNRDREFAVKLAELRELTQTLKGFRESDDKKKAGQLDQLSNVYGSMDPKEAAILIEQLDETIAIAILNRMPEKRIGQILSLMNKEKALMITRVLSGKFGA